MIKNTSPLLTGEKTRSGPRAAGGSSSRLQTGSSAPRGPSACGPQSAGGSERGSSRETGAAGPRRTRGEARRRSPPPEPQAGGLPRAPDLALPRAPVLARAQAPGVETGSGSARGRPVTMRLSGETGSRPTATPCGCVKPALETGNLLTEPIGFLESCFLTKNGTPRQPSICSHSRACLRIRKSIFNNPEHSLMGLEQFSHIWVLFVFHKNGHLSCKAKVQPPRLNGAKVGVFSTRSPHRPNAIGLTLATLEKVEGGALYLSGIDMIHGTPVLDVKPYIADYDAPQSFTEPLADCSSRSDRRQPKATSPSGAETQSCDQRQLPECIEPQLHSSPEEKPKCLEDGPPGEKDKTNDSAADAWRNSTGPGVVAAERGSGPRGGRCAAAAGEAADPDALDRSVSEGDAERRPRSGAGAAGPQEHRTESVVGAAQRCAVPTWVKEAPLVASLQVRFTPHAEKDLAQLSSEGEADARQVSFRYFQSAQEARWAIEAVLAADPRSVYRRKLCRDRLYYFSVDGAHVTCWFGDDFAEVLRIKPAPETVRGTDAATESLVSLGS